MRILYLCKRQYMGQDVIEDRYARLYEQPFQLAELGHNVLGVCLSYRYCTTKDELHPTTKGSMRWVGLSAGKLRLNLITYPFALLKITKEFKPDIIVGASDCLHIIVAHFIAKLTGIKLTIDLYDHFETFGLAKIPLVKHFYRNALRNANVVSCVSEPLSNLIKEEHKAKGNIFTLHSTIDKNIFYPKNKYDCREILSLPPDAKLIGTAGGLYKEKGIETVYKAYLKLHEVEPDLHLALAGPIDTNCPPPRNDHTHYLGMMPHSDISTFFCALDVGIIYLKNTKYGQYSFPQKAYEMASCNIPLIAADVGTMKDIFQEECDLYEPDNFEDLANKILGKLNSGKVQHLTILDWKDQAKIMEQAYLKIL